MFEIETALHILVMNVEALSTENGVKFESKFIAMTNINDCLTCKGKIINIELKDSLKRFSLKLLVIDSSGKKKLSGSAIVELKLNEKK